MAIDSIEMSVERWIKIPDNPRQRNTEKRANRARLNHLRQYCPIHRFVFAATIDSEIVCKLDGHTRAFLWADGSLDPPPSSKVVVNLIAVRDMAEAKEAYDMLDSRPAVKRPDDDVFGATRENDFVLSSSLLKNCRFSNQLKLADSGIFVGQDTYALVKRWKPYLIALDGLDLSRSYTILISAMVLAIRRDGVAKAGGFFKALDQNAGIKDSRGMDGPEALRQHINNRRAHMRMSGSDNLQDILARAWSAYSLWLEDKRVKTLGPSEKVWDVIRGFNQDDKGKGKKAS